MQIHEAKDGTCKVYNNNGDVLEPGRLRWLPHYQDVHDFIYFPSRAKAEQAISLKLHKEAQKTIVKIHTLELKSLSS